MSFTLREPRDGKSIFSTQGWSGLQHDDEIDEVPAQFGMP